MFRTMASTHPRCSRSSGRRWPGAILFSLGVVADNALGLTPVVFLASGLFFALTALTYVEGASLHQERGARGPSSSGTTSTEPRRSAGSTMLEKP